MHATAWSEWALRYEQGNERLLKLYESGLPAWAIYMPLYRLPYRPWMRKVGPAYHAILLCFGNVSDASHLGCTCTVSCQSSTKGNSKTWAVKYCMCAGDILSLHPYINIFPGDWLL